MNAPSSSASSLRKGNVGQERGETAHACGGRAGMCSPGRRACGRRPGEHPAARRVADVRRWVREPGRDGRADPGGPRHAGDVLRSQRLRRVERLHDLGTGVRAGGRRQRDRRTHRRPRRLADRERRPGASRDLCRPGHAAPARAGGHRLCVSLRRLQLGCGIDRPGVRLQQRADHVLVRLDLRAALHGVDPSPGSVYDDDRGLSAPARR